MKKILPVIFFLVAILFPFSPSLTGTAHAISSDCTAGYQNPFHSTINGKDVVETTLFIQCQDDYHSFSGWGGLKWDQNGSGQNYVDVGLHANINGCTPCSFWEGHPFATAVQSLLQGYHYKAYLFAYEDSIPIGFDAPTTSFLYWLPN